ncbi:DUF484 family protein [Shewanella yunxiaonensis]|uniref:DUF484 family protein n=1 Tax=Shewanella yunxiaonensis TaxID=2829809 RepID=A0ABX7YVU5_9GAMM|nr:MULTISPECIES: DUF484 family protein [Shewanella]MDF0534982.1 DUF484 family protein [Shewanella sp. A32]QUN06206.1 DUF484 family protein [Shewanella yunxiaonensis]
MTETVATETEVTERMDAPFDEQIIREYLLDNPDFFTRFPELLLAMVLPHGEKGTISLVEKRQEILRHRVNQLEEEITTLMSMATRNERIYRFNTQLCRKLLDCEDIGELRQVLTAELKSEFHFSHVRLITVHDIDSELSTIWHKRLKKGYYFGRLTRQESHRLFGTEVGSVSLARLSEDNGQVIFAIASEDVTHFHPEMDSMLLEQVRQLLDHLLPKL